MAIHAPAIQRRATCANGLNLSFHILGRPGDLEAECSDFSLSQGSQELDGATDPVAEILSEMVEPTSDTRKVALLAPFAFFQGLGRPSHREGFINVTCCQQQSFVCFRNGTYTLLWASCSSSCRLSVTCLHRLESSQLSPMPHLTHCEGDSFARSSFWLCSGPAVLCAICSELALFRSAT